MPEIDIEIWLDSPDGETYEVSDRTGLQDLGQIHLSVERNLHAFRAGDLSLRLDNGDAFFDDLFSDLKPSDRWGIRVFRDRHLYFSGVLIPGDTITFDRFEAAVDLTFLDRSKLLEDVRADAIRRTTTIYEADGAGNTAGATTLTLLSTAGLFNDDVLEFVGRDYRILYVVSATQARIDPPLEVTIPDGTKGALTTPYHRFKTPSDLIDLLLDEAAVEARSVNLDGDPGSLPIISEISTNRNGAVSGTLGDTMVQRGGLFHVGNGVTLYTQDDPADDWTNAGADPITVDWTPYRKYSDGEPTTHLESPVSGPAINAWDFQPAPSTSTRYFLSVDNAGAPKTVKIRKQTSTDGIVWAAASDVATVGSGSANGYHTTAHQIEFDPVRNLVFYSWQELSPGTDVQFGVWDVGASVHTVLDTNIFLFGLRYSREVDYMIGVVKTTAGGGFPDTNRIQAWRGQARLWERTPVFDINDPPLTKFSRYFNGVWYSGGGDVTGGKLFISKDEWQTVTILPVSGGTGVQVTIVNGSVRMRATEVEPEVFHRYYILAPGFAGVIPYADFSDLSVAAALDELAILLNAVLSVDPQGTVRFAVRRRRSRAEALVLDPLVVGVVESSIWVEYYERVIVTGGEGVESAVGTPTGPARELSTSCRFASSRAVASSLAASLLDFYGKKRALLRLSAEDEGEPVALLDPVLFEERSFVMYEQALSLATHEAEYVIVEDL